MTFFYQFNAITDRLTLLGEPNQDIRLSQHLVVYDSMISVYVFQ